MLKFIYPLIFACIFYLGIIIQIPNPVPVQQPVSPTSTPIVTNDELIKAYNDISTQVIENSKSTIELAKWLIGSAIAIILGAGGGIIYLVNQSRLAQDAATRSATTANESKVIIEAANEKIQAALIELKGTKDGIESLKKQMKYLLPQQIGQIVKWVDIQNHNMKLYSQNGSDQVIARTSLLEYSRDTDPIIRLECIRLFRYAIENNHVEVISDEVTQRLRDISSTDVEILVRTEADTTLKLIK